MSNRQGRIKAVIEKDVRDIIIEISKDYNLGFLTVSNVEVSDDYNYVKVFVSFYQNELSNFEKLEKKVGLIKKELSHKLSLRRAPNIQIILDRSFTYKSKIEKILDEESKQLEQMKRKDNNDSLKD